MRDIKFRCWDKRQKKMFPAWIGRDGVEFGSQGWASNILKDDYEFMQFTGLRDRHGKEIYEGDIVKGPQRNGFARKDLREKLFNAQVYWNEDEAGFRRSTIGDFWTGDYRWAPHWNEVEVIGNIFENGDLLKCKP